MIDIGGLILYICGIIFYVHNFEYMVSYGSIFGTHFEIDLPFGTHEH
jgi:hypothetical protein